MTVPTPDGRHLRTAARMLELLLRELGRRVSVRHAWTLLRIAEAGHEGIDQRIVARQIGNAAATRAVYALGDIGWRRDADGYGRVGVDLIESRIDPRNHRLRRLTLTSSGRRLVERLQEAAE